ncbi:MAG: SDR family NAD(P)-dependent oxidoreductase [Anaerolineae bacterium]|nr:SDR family NAD(P)-dependent oxidoreductase [Anaerolineae bacterium]
MTNQPVVLITGASSGIGAASAKLFAGAGYRVVLAARRVELLETLVQEITALGGEAAAISADVSSLPSINHMVQAALDAYGQIDVLLNNAGFGRLKWLEELDPEGDIAAQIEVNLMGVIQTTRAVLPHMLARKSGHIVNMASMASFIGTPTLTIYAASKYAVRGFTEALRREVGVFGIRASGIYPGGVKTEFEAHTQAFRKTGITTPKALQLSPEDVARAVLGVVRKGRSRSVVMPGIMWASIWLNRLVPWFNDWVIERTFTRPERGL